MCPQLGVAECWRSATPSGRLTVCSGMSFTWLSGRQAEAGALPVWILMRRSQAWGLRNRWFADSSLDSNPPERFWSDPQSQEVVLRVAQPACRARREYLQQRVFGIG